MEHRDTVKEGILVHFHHLRISRVSALCKDCKLTARLDRVIESEGLHDDADEAYDRPEKTEDPDNSDDIEDRMRTRSPLCRCICHSSCNISCDCCSYVLSKHHGDSKLEVDEA